MNKEKEIEEFRLNVLPVYEQYLKEKKEYKQINHKGKVVKQCRICGKYKVLSAFYKNPLKKLGRFDECKECLKKNEKVIKVHEVSLKKGDKYMNNVINISGESKKYIRAKEICGMFNIARSTVDNWAKYGLLTRRPIGGGIFYDYEEVKKLPRVRNGKNS